MKISEIVKALNEQARDKDLLANGDADSIFAADAAVLRDAAELLQKLARDSLALMYEHD